MHYYFSVLDLPQEFGCQKIYQETKNIKVDIKANGGYVVAPPTSMKIQENGNGAEVVEYQWVCEKETGYGRPFLELSFAELQKMVVELKQRLGMVEQKEEKKELPTGKIDLEKFKFLLKKHYEKGKRQNLCIFAAGFLLKSGMPKEEVVQFFEHFVTEVNDEEPKMRLAGVKHTVVDFETDPENIKGITGLIEKGIPEEEIQKCFKNKEKEIQGKTHPFFVINKDVYTIAGKNHSLKWVGPYFDVTAKVFHKGVLQYLLKPVDRDEILVDPRDIKSIAGALGKLPRVINSKEFAEFFDVQCEKAQTKKLCG